MYRQLLQIRYDSFQLRVVQIETRHGGVHCLSTVIDAIANRVAQSSKGVRLVRLIEPVQSDARALHLCCFGQRDSQWRQ